MNHPEFIDLPPLLSAQGTIRLPGSKSISNRALLLAALSEGVIKIHDVLRSDDTDRMLEALDKLGIKIEALGNNAYCVTGCGGTIPNKGTDAEPVELFLGNAGTAFRPLTAVLALSRGHYILKGVSRMHERPIKDLVDALGQLGANIKYLGNEGFPPLEIFPADIKGDTVKIRGDVSSQFLTGLLMALPLLGKFAAVHVVGELISKPYIEITLAMMRRFGDPLWATGGPDYVVDGRKKYHSPASIHVEGDASSASYFLAAGAIGGGPVRVEGVGRDSVQGDVRFADALEEMGAQIEWGKNWIVAEAPASGKLKALVDFDCNHIPDAAMTLAVAALFADGTTTLRNIASWRVKETDRIAAMATELRKLGATVEEGADYIRVIPPQIQNQTPSNSPLSGGEQGSGSSPDKGRLGGVGVASILNPVSGIDTYDDHRMAMCFSLAAFGGAGVRINDPKCVAKTFPDYFERFAQVVKAVPVIAIDGPSASGKGTVALRVAQVLGYHFLDSGAMYRLLGLAAQRRGIALDEEAQLAELASQIDIRFEGAEIWLNGEKVGDELRSEQSGAAASSVATLHKVRTALLDRQRAFRRAPGLVADGRDMGSVVFPDAVLKVFLTASAEARAERRYKQLKEKGMNANIANLLQDIRARDERDSQRSAAPLQQAPGAGLLDTTDLAIEQAVQEVLARYRAL